MLNNIFLQTLGAPMEYPNAGDNQQQFSKLNTDLASAMSLFQSSQINNKLQAIPLLCNILHILLEIQKQPKKAKFIDVQILSSTISQLLQVIKSDFNNPIISTCMMNSWYFYCHNDMLGDIISHFIGLLDSNESELWVIKSMLRGLFMHAMKLDRTLLPIVTPVMVRELNVDGQEVMRQIKQVNRQAPVQVMKYINPTQINHSFTSRTDAFELLNQLSMTPISRIVESITHILTDVGDDLFQSVIQKSLLVEKSLPVAEVSAPTDPRVRFEDSNELDQQVELKTDISDSKEALSVLLSEITNYSDYFTNEEIDVWKSISSYIYARHLHNTVKPTSDMDVDGLVENEDNVDTADSMSEIVSQLQDQVHVLLKIAYYLYYKTELYEIFVHLVLRIGIKNIVLFISEIPYISDATLDLIGNELIGSELQELAILQSIINFKPKQRLTAIDYLCKCSISPNKIIRAQSTTICNSFVQPQIKSIISKFAIQNFELIDFNDPELISQHVELFMSMLIKDAMYFNEFIRVYLKIEHKQELRQLFMIYLTQMDNYDELLVQVEKHAPTCPELVLDIVQHLQQPSKVLLEMTRRLVDNGFTPRILIPVIHAFAKPDLLHYLPFIFNEQEELPKDKAVVESPVKQCLTRVLITIQDNNAHLLTPSELLVLVHKSESVLADPTGALADVLDLNEVHTEPVLMITLKELITLDTIPELTMITVQYCIENHEKMIKFITNELLASMVRKMIWNSAGLWSSFKHICDITQPQCFGVVLDLPLTPFKELCEDKPTIKQKLKNLIGNSTHLRHSKRIRPLLPILEAN
eukprot:NODE_489_length_7778_cov_0.178409.p1 type:complete len:811 gc:universal NODE_489_length_7778_cov_0.178409:1900-4332(+)